MPGGGGDQARLAHILDNWLKEADPVGPRKVVFLRDRDELGIDQQTELVKKGFVKFLPCREIENYLLDAPALFRVLKPELMPSTSGADIEAAIREIADELKETVVLGRVWWQLPPIQLVTHQLRSQLADDEDKLGKLVNTVREALLDPDELEAKVRTLWAEAAADVEARWPDEWRSLVPGSTLLNKLYQRFLSRDYDKDVDGPKIAHALSEPPQSLVDLLADVVEVPISVSKN